MKNPTFLTTSQNITKGPDQIIYVFITKNTDNDTNVALFLIKHCHCPLIYVSKSAKEKILIATT